jgi:predicted nucleic-acid-binding protein
MSAFVDTNIVVRHLAGEPADTASRATAYLAAEPELFVADLIVAETIYVLESC